MRPSEVVVGRTWVLACLGTSGCLAFWTPCDAVGDSMIAGGDFPTLQCWEDIDRTWDGDVTLDPASGTLGEEPALRVDNPFPAEAYDDITVVQQGGNTLMRDTLFVEDGRTVTIALWSKASAPRGFQVTLRDRDTDDVLQQWPIGATATWTEHALEYLTAIDQDLVLQLDVGGSDEATLWLDDVSMVAVEEGDD